MSNSDDDLISIDLPEIPAQVFGAVTPSIEHALTELIIDIALSADYQGDDAINHAMNLISATHTLQEYLFFHLHQLQYTKKLAAYEKLPSTDSAKCRGIYPRDSVH